MVYLIIISIVCSVFFFESAVATEEHDAILAATVVVRVPPTKPPAAQQPSPFTSVIKSTSIINAEIGGDITIAPTDKVEYDVSYRIGQGKSITRRIKGNRVVIEVKEMEFDARQQGLTFSVVGITQVTT